jgi:ligand-binding SRPBCC domain-containing protein
MHLLSRDVLIPAPQLEVFRFFEDTRNLERITPRWVGFEDVTHEGPPLYLGMKTAHRLRWSGIVLRWNSRIVEYEPPLRFVDEQTSGPYRHWRHEHYFESVEGGTLMRDRVQYELPLGILGNVVQRLIIARQLRRIFDYRERRIKRLFVDAMEPRGAATLHVSEQHSNDD